MVEWFRCLTRIHKILYSNLDIIIYRMTLDKSLMTKLSQTTHSYRANISSISTLDAKRDRYRRLQKERDGRNWLYVDPNNNRSWSQQTICLWEVIVIVIKGCVESP